MTDISRATLGRIPAYLRYLKNLPPCVQTISATVIARELGLGEVQVRKDLGALCGTGKPKIGYVCAELIDSLEGCLRSDDGGTVIVGAGKLGRALLDYGGFAAAGRLRYQSKPAGADAGRPAGASHGAAARLLPCASDPARHHRRAGAVGAGCLQSAV